MAVVNTDNRTGNEVEEDGEKIDELNGLGKNLSNTLDLSVPPEKNLDNGMEQNELEKKKVENAVDVQVPAENPNKEPEINAREYQALLDSDTVRSKRVAQLLGAITEESNVEIEEMSAILEKQAPKVLAAKNLAILNLIIDSMRTGLGGRSILKLRGSTAYIKPGQRLDTAGFQTGDIVKIESMQRNRKSVAASEQTNQFLVEGVVSEIGDSTISVALDDKYDDQGFSTTDNDRLWIAKLVNQATFNRMELSLENLKKMKNPSRLVDICLGVCEPRRSDDDKEVMSEFQFFDSTLNPGQQSAVRSAVNDDTELSIIHGPPGTGKTYTIIEIIRQLVVNRGQRVLVCGPSNISVDNVLERLDGALKGDQMVRIGHPARLKDSILKHSLEVISKTGDGRLVLDDLRKDIEKTLGKLSRKQRTGKKELYKELKLLRKEFRQREKKVVTDILLQAKVVVTTLHGSGSFHLREAVFRTGKPIFDTIIIDEVSQALEAQCWIPIVTHVGATRLIIAGDNQQLGPTIKTRSAKYKKVLDTTLFDRFVSMWGSKFIDMLRIQYRMNSSIMKFPSKQLYHEKLVADDAVAARTLSQLPGVSETDLTLSPVTWIDTQGGDFPESIPPEDDTKAEKKYISAANLSRWNEYEAYLVRNYVLKLLDLNVSESDIGIISPYSAQVSLISKLLYEQHPLLEISTVDGFQGREKEAIVISLVRSNEKGEVGFLSEYRRLNVAMTRPKRHLCVIGDMSTLERSDNEYLKSWAQWCQDSCDLEYADIDEVIQST